MANKRMFTMKICDSDAFLDMPLSTQCLYFHLCMRADDDGFIGNPKRIKALVGASDDDLRLLVAKRFLIVFEDGVIVIKHWKMHNTIQKDRYTPTQYQDELSQLFLKSNNAYALACGNNMETKCIQNVSTDIDIGSGIDTATDIHSGDKSPRTQKAGAEKKSEVYKHIVDYLNAKAGTQYKASCKDTRAKIDARLAENFTVTDFETVIDKKCEEWRGTEWEKFLRPLTLFGPKFESYLNAKIISSNKAAPKPNRVRDLGNKRTYTAEEIDSMGYDLLGGD